MGNRWIVAVLVVGLVAGYACEGANAPLSMSAPGSPSLPAVKGYAAGEEILFVHTEASDPAIADTLTAMMRSPVFTVPALAEAPESMRAPVYVFANGVKPSGARGPLDFQPDVFPCPPEKACYRPLREVHLVTWADPGEARVLKSAAEIREAAARGEVAVEGAGVVVNMPFLEWPGGKR